MREQYLQTALDLTGEIETKQNTLFIMAATTGNYEEALANRKSFLMQRIGAAINAETGKPVYSNEAARNAELIMRVALDNESEKMRKSLLEARNTQDRARNEIAKLQSQVSLYKAFLNGGE